MQFKLLLVPIFLNYCICTAYNVHSVHTYLYGLLALRLFSLFAPLFILCVHFSDYYCFWWLSNWNWFHLHLFVEHITYTHSYNKILCACISFLSTIKKKSNKPVACVQFIHHTHRTFSNIEENEQQSAEHIVFIPLTAQYAHENQLLDIFGCVCVCYSKFITFFLSSILLLF